MTHPTRRPSDDTLNHCRSNPGYTTAHIRQRVPVLDQWPVAERHVIATMAQCWHLTDDEAAELLDVATATGDHLLRLHVTDAGTVELVTHDDPPGRPRFRMLAVPGHPDQTLHRLRLDAVGQMYLDEPPAPAAPGSRWITTHQVIDRAAQPLTDQFTHEAAERDAAERRRVALDATVASHGPDLDTLAALVAVAELPPTALTVAPALEHPEYGSPVIAAIEVRGDDISRLATMLSDLGVPTTPDVRPLWTRQGVATDPGVPPLSFAKIHRRLHDRTPAESAARQARHDRDDIGRTAMAVAEAALAQGDRDTAHRMAVIAAQYDAPDAATLRDSLNSATATPPGLTDLEGDFLDWSQTPGLDGTHSQSCVACLRGTDTAVAFTGPVEWAVAGVQVMGVEPAAALMCVAQVLDCAPDALPAGEVTVTVRVCPSCAEASGTGMTPAVLPSVNQYRPPTD